MNKQDAISLYECNLMYCRLRTTEEKSVLNSAKLTVFGIRLSTEVGYIHITESNIRVMHSVKGYAITDKFNISKDEFEGLLNNFINR